MSIFPTADLISEVTRAADPRRAQIATKRLEAIAEARASSPGHLPSYGAIVPADARVSTPLVDTSRPTATASTRLTAAQQFEAFLLQHWLEAMLSDASDDAPGADMSGSVWRSMMAEQIGAQIARSGVTGLHRILDFPTATAASAER